ncbi:MAG: glycosyltransferase family 2 protein [Patescibacteria group bacterium]
MKRLLVVIPAFNEEETIGKVLRSLPKQIPGKIRVDVLVINDGSQDQTLQISKKMGALVITHLINRGLGAALGTAFSYAKAKGYDWVLTFDADGQHQVTDVVKVLNPLIKNRADVVIGSRLLKKDKMPILRQIINKLSNVLTWVLFNIWTSDSQSGLRGFNKSALEEIEITSQRMEVSSELFKEISRLKLRKVEVPIQAVYTKYSLSKGQRLSNAPNVFWKLLLQRFGNI